MGYKSSFWIVAYICVSGKKVRFSTFFSRNHEFNSSSAGKGDREPGIRFQGVGNRTPAPDRGQETQVPRTLPRVMVPCSDMFEYGQILYK